MTNDDYKRRVIERSEFETLEDGFKYFWIDEKGAISSAELRIIADYLDCENEELNLSIEEYFNKRK